MPSELNNCYSKNSVPRIIILYSIFYGILQIERLECSQDLHYYAGRQTNPVEVTQCTSEDDWKCKSSEQCIPRGTKCDGKRDCKDGSDEAFEGCDHSRYRFRVARAVAGNSENGICEIPSGPFETKYTNDDTDNWLSISPGSKIPKYSRILISCDSDYLLPDGGKSQELSCIRKDKWNPPLKQCGKLCPVLKTTNLDLSCYREERKVDCNGNIAQGTTAQPQCKPLFHSDRFPDYRELTCQENGNWDHELYKCVTDCGVLTSNPETLIYDGNATRTIDSPWNVAIYDIARNYTLICGGTLINTRMVVSAAHCFYDRKNGVPANDTAKYEIMVGKYTRDHKIKDNSQQKAFKIADLIFTDTGYNPTLTGQYGHDIIVVVLKETVDISEYVMPACIDWSASSTSGFTVRDGTLGRLAGWGENKNGKANDVLLFAELPFINYHKCKGKLKTIAPDHFCAGSESGPGARRGDSGAGLIFYERQKSLYFLRGIVSTKDSESSSSIATFTDISKHIDWLYKVRNEVEEEDTRPDTETICSSYNTPGNTWTCKRRSECVWTAEITNTNQEHKCGSGKYIRKICCPKSRPKPSANTTTPKPITPDTRPKDHIQIIRQKCAEYSQARYFNKCDNGNVSGQRKNCKMQLDCKPAVVDDKLFAEPGVYPHVGLLGFGSSLENEISWLCGCTLISERFLLSLGRCSSFLRLGSAKWVALGFLNRSELTSDKLNRNIFTILKTFVHPKFDQDFNDNDIALYQLENPIKFTPLIRPICLHTEYAIPRETANSSMMLGWGSIESGEIESETLKKSAIPVLPVETCVTFYQNYTQLKNGFDGKTMLCAGNLRGRYDTCTGDSGGPLQINHQEMCMYVQIGIISFGSSTCNDHTPGGYTRVSAYLKWIQTIVWKNV